MAACRVEKRSSLMATPSSASSPLVTVQNPGSLVGPTFTVTDASSNNVLNVTGSSLGFYNTAAVAQPASTSTTRQALARMGLIGAGGGSVANNRLTMTSTERMTLSSTSRLTILDFGTGAGNGSGTQSASSSYVGSPKSWSSPFSVGNGFYLYVPTRLTMSGSTRATLEGNADLLISGDFASRQRLVLAG
jgi:hypothetical protein